MSYIRDFNQIDDISALGSKGLGLSLMSSLGLNVPPGFNITTELCKQYYANNKQLPSSFIIELQQAIRRLEKITGKIFGETLLLSVRSGSVYSMPGMMDTVLNVNSNLENHIKTVLDSWMSERAESYRRLHNIPENLGTAVTIQTMVFGDKDAHSGTGVVFTRNPSNGKNELYGEFLYKAQGEALVSGTHNPEPIEALKVLMPNIYKELLDICIHLENHFKDMQDIEFTIESGVLYILQTRSGKRSANARIKIEVDMALEGKISKQEAIMRIDPECLKFLLHASIDQSKTYNHVAQGLPASPGAATGLVAFSCHEAEKMSQSHKVILVRHDTSPDDIYGMSVSEGILTAKGGMTSHAAVVTRGMGKPCICGASQLEIDELNRTLIINDLTIKEGDEITIDGDSGKIFLGSIPKITPEFSEEFNTLMKWADAESKLKVRANVETQSDAEIALKMGAVGIGLCRTEHMFFEPSKLRLIRKMIVASDESSRKKALDELLPLHKDDFKSIFKIMNGLPATVRLLDPPLHEFLPKDYNEKLNLSSELNIDIQYIENRLREITEINPMLGFRGCRLGIVHPEIYEMQVKAICTAAKELAEQEGVSTEIEIMIPLVANSNELKNIRSLILSCGINCKIGTMIELPRAALQADKIAEYADFFSFGTNDLTQTTYGISRDDVSSFIQYYLDNELLANDPFVTLDQEGVGQLIKIGVERGRQEKPNLKIGICGEHGGDPASINFFHEVGLDYVSCSAYRVPIARLAAAKAAIKSIYFL